MGPSATYYDILRVSRRAAPDGVRIMAMLNEAYGVLSDADRRAHYDRRIEDERACAQRRLRRRFAPVEVPTAAWPWYLLFATAAFAVAAVGTVLYKTMVPGVAVAVAAPSVQAATPQVAPPARPQPKTR